jgi:hypothetical protein
MFEFLTKFLSFFVPQSEQITDAAWFRDDESLHLLALKLCYYSKGYLVTPRNLQTLSHRVLLMRFVEACDPCYLDNLVKNIEDGEYFLTRSWFCRNESTYQMRTLMLKTLGHEAEIQPLSGTLTEDLDNLLYLYLFGIHVLPEDEEEVAEVAQVAQVADAEDWEDNYVPPYDPPYEGPSEEVIQIIINGEQDVEMDHDEAHREVTNEDFDNFDDYFMTEEQWAEYYETYEERAEIAHSLREFDYCYRY